MLDSYSAVQTAVAKWLGGRTDLTAQIPDFIALAEARIRRKVRRRTVRATINIASGAITLPADCIELRSLHLVSARPTRDLPFRIGTMEQLTEIRARHPQPGRPTHGAVVGNTLYVAPAPDVSYPAEILYYEKLISLSDAQPSNATLLEAPELYLYGALLQAANYLEHDERIPVWKSIVDETMAELDTAREREETNASLQPVRLPVVF